MKTFTKTKMKPYINCPHCNTVLYSKHVGSDQYTQYCNDVGKQNCPIEFSQKIKRLSWLGLPYDDLQAVIFVIKDFEIVQDYSWLKKGISVWSRNIDDPLWPDPIIQIKQNVNLNFSNLQSIEEKVKLWLTFS